MTAEVRFESRGTLATVTLRQSARFNAMSLGMWQQLRVGFAQLAEDAAVRCVVVRGEGGHFCAGGDIAEYPQFRFDAVQLRDFHENTVWGALQSMRDCDVPLLALIEGNCMGAGLEIASCCDIRIAGVSSRFGAPIARLGFPMAPRELDLVLRAAGTSATREMLLEAMVLEAPRMLQLGFLNRCVPDETVAEAGQLAQQRIGALAPQAARMHKRMLRSLMAADRSGPVPSAPVTRARDDRHTRIDALVATAYDYAESREHREGIAAFIAKRKPEF